ncbi:hypothetical protein KP509_14G020400 [Ceratopteris richardii]|uniref:Reverse transcriptase zinc-binding domain-containing protein n=1 Tax=Ceratopteris richardii TaxID=49495 RepID=A0A8T2T630_CERRI|nr:hypothetical protein KP509_14G020400 [Ceratopteris richardii]
MFYLLEAKLKSNLIHGISMFGNSHVAVGFVDGFVDETFIFAKAEAENVQNILACLEPFSEAASLCINMGKSVLINISARHFESLPWYCPKVDSGTIFRHLGYPLGINVPIKDKIRWVLCKVRAKMKFWQASQWPLHIRIRIVQAFMQPYLMYYLLLLDWKKCHLQDFDCLIKDFLWNKKHNRALVLSAWRYVCQPKSRGGLGILHLHAHIMARRTAFIMRITSSFEPLWTEIFWQLMEDAVVYYKGNWKLDVWNKFFSHAPVRASSHTLNILLHSFKQLGSTLKWNGQQRYVGNSFASLSPYWSFLTTPPLAFSLGAAARYFNNKGIDSIAKCYDSKWEILSFPVICRTYAVGSAYRSKWIQIALFLQEYQVPLSIDFSDPWRDWLLAKHTRWWTGKVNTFYPSLLPFDDITLQCNARWKIEKASSWWHARFLHLWGSSLTFRMKIFMWRIFTGHFTLGAFLSIRVARCSMSPLRFL